MGMTNNNLCDSCTNIGCEFQSGIVRTECAFYMPPHLEPDSCGNFVVMQPTVEAIPKADYEARLRAEKIAMLEELRTEIDNMPKYYPYTDHSRCYIDGDVFGLIQQKINALKGEKE